MSLVDRAAHDPPQEIKGCVVVWPVVILCGVDHQTVVMFVYVLHRGRNRTLLKVINTQQPHQRKHNKTHAAAAPAAAATKATTEKGDEATAAAENCSSSSSSS